MIKSLRRNIILINMIPVSVVIALIIAMLCVNTYSNSSKELENSLNAVVESAEEESPVQLNSYAELRVDSNGRILDIIENSASVDGDVLQKCVDIAVKDSKSSGQIYEYNMMYAVKARGNHKFVAIADAASIYSSLRNSVLISAILFVGSLIILFIISFLLSGRVVKPVKAALENKEQFEADASDEPETTL